MAWLWRAGAKLSLVASAVGGGVTTALIATSDDPETALKLCATVPHRLFSDAFTAANIAFGTFNLPCSRTFYERSFNLAFVFLLLFQFNLPPHEIDY